MIGKIFRDERGLVFRLRIGGTPVPGWVVEVLYDPRDGQLFAHSIGSRVVLMDCDFGRYTELASYEA